MSLQSSNGPRDVGAQRAALGLDASASRRGRTEDALMDACRQVEGLFINQLMAQMHESTWGEGMLGRSTARTILAQRRDAALAEEMGRRGALGLARMLHEELGAQPTAKPPESSQQPVTDPDAAANDGRPEASAAQAPDVGEAPELARAQAQEEGE